LVFGNRTTNDILLKDELLTMADKFSTNFNLYLTVDVKPDDSENWQQGVGFITKEMLKEQIPLHPEKPLCSTVVHHHSRT